MVFANLADHEKDAFFTLLDEYFSSRPDLLSNAGTSEATSRLVSAGLKHGIPKSSPYASAASNPQVGAAVGKFAASSAFNNNARNDSTSSSTPVSNAVAAGKNMFGPLRNSKPTSPSPSSNSATSTFAARTNPFAPPVRHAPSDTQPSAPGHVPTPQIEEPEEESQGEWAEALYDYSSQESTDLEIRANERVLVTERTSPDWWTGEYNGKTGLFPASYVKIL